MLIKFPSIIIGICFFDDYSENSMESRAEDNKSITSEERDENSSESSGSEEEQSSIHWAILYIWRSGSRLQGVRENMAAVTSLG